MIFVAATSTLARDANESSSATSKSSASKRKAKASRAKAEKKANGRKKQSAQLPGTGNIDVSGMFGTTFRPRTSQPTSLTRATKSQPRSILCGAAASA